MIHRLPRSTQSLLSSAQLYPTFEATITTVLSNLHPDSTSTRIIIHPQALRFKFLTNATTPPPLSFLMTLSTISSLELQTPGEKLHLRGGRQLSRETGDFGVGIVLDVWELFYSIPVRRRLETSRDEVSVIAATRDSVVRQALSYPGKRLSLSNDQEIYTFGGSITEDALQTAFGLSVTWLRVSKHDQHTKIDGYVAKQGTGYTSYQLLVGPTSSVHEQRICEIVNKAWRTLPKEGRKRCAAFVISVEGRISEDLLRSAIKEAFGISLKDRVQQQIVMPNKKKRVSLQPRFEETMIKRPQSEHVVSQTRLSVKVDTKKRPASAVEDAYKRMIPSWKNPCLPSRSRSVLSASHDKRSLCITKERIANVRIVGQVDNKFIIISDEEGIYAVDQHAASERHHYETLLKSCEMKRRSHKLANPRMVNIPMALRALAQKVLRDAEEWGWRVDDGFIVTHVPELPPVNAVLEPDSLVEWFEDGFQGGKQIPSAVTRIAASAACHSAVRFGDELSREMCRSIVTSLAECDVPFVCAHGRPNVVPIVAFDKT